MKNEAEFKSAFKKSVRAQGGFAISLAAPMMSGIPDLYTIMPGFMPVLIEAKWLGKLGDKFNRKIPYTKMQKFYMDECNKIRPFSALGLVGYKQYNTYWAVLTGILNDGTISNEHSNYPRWNHTIYCTYDNKQFDVLGMFKYIGVPQLNGIHATSA